MTSFQWIMVIQLIPVVQELVKSEKLGKVKSSSSQFPQEARLESCKLGIEPT
jgi:hypothetical protein